MQLRDLRAYCTARQPDVVREYVFDAGQSGTKDSRPELSELMSAVHRRKPDAVIVWRLTDLPVRRDTFLPRWKSSAHLVSGSFRTKRTSIPAPLGRALFTIGQDVVACVKHRAWGRNVQQAFLDSTAFSFLFEKVRIPSQK